MESGLAGDSTGKREEEKAEKAHLSLSSLKPNASCSHPQPIASGMCHFRVRTRT
jgi:hypothetical protein